MDLFERYLSLWVALCIATGVTLGNLFPQTIVVGVLVEVPVMLSLVAFTNRTAHWFR
jgi:ACR3 family arsenite transporter